MKKLIALACGVIMLFMVSCAGIAVKQEAVDVAIEVGAFTLGYEGCKGERDTFKQMASFAKDGMRLVEIDQLELNVLVEELRRIGAESISNDPLTQYQIKKLLSLLDITLDEGQVNIAEDKYEYVKLAVRAFIQGVDACN